jgi:hypothetical protein
MQCICTLQNIRLRSFPSHHRAAGNWLFAHRRWVNLDDPNELERLVEGYRHLCMLIPSFASCSLELFVCLVAATSCRWSERCQDQDSSEDVTRGHMHNSLSLGVQSIKGGDEAEDINSDLEEGVDFAWCCSAVQHPSSGEIPAGPGPNPFESDTACCLPPADTAKQSVGSLPHAIGLFSTGPHVAQGVFENVARQNRTVPYDTTWAAGCSQDAAAASDALALWLLREARRVPTNSGSGRGQADLNQRCSGGQGWVLEADDVLDGLWGQAERSARDVTMS